MLEYAYFDGMYQSIYYMYLYSYFLGNRGKNALWMVILVYELQHLLFFIFVSY